MYGVGERVTHGTGETLETILKRCDLAISVRYHPLYQNFVVVWRDRDGRIGADARHTHIGIRRAYLDVVASLSTQARAA